MMDDICHVFVLTTLSLDENGDVKSRNVAVTFDLFEAKDHRNRGVEHEYDVFVMPGDSREDAEQSNLVKALRDLREMARAEAGGTMSLTNGLRHYLVKGKQSVRAAGLMLKLIETEPTPENLELLADIFIQQGLFDHAKALYLRVVEAGLKWRPLVNREALP